MARPQRSRRICHKPRFTMFSPEGAICSGVVELTVDEYEVIRLVDYENSTHEQCAQRMDISRTTVTEIYSSARYKVADAIVNGKSIVIQGGRYRFCNGDAGCCGGRCGRLNKDNFNDTL